MRKVKVTKNFLKKGLLAFGLTKSQIITIIIAAVIAAGMISVAFAMGWSINIVMQVVFVEILIIVGAVVFKIEGMSLFKYLFVLLLCADDVRAFSNCKKEVRESEKE